MSSPNYHEVLALARELKENERLKLILEISKTMNDVLINKKAKELYCPYCHSSHIVKNGKNKTTQRYLCKTCLKSFICVTNTPIYYSRKEINTWSEYVHCKVKSFMRPYKGVSTKYLSNYMFLFKYIESKCEATPIFFRGTKPYFSTNFKGRPPIFS